MFSVKEEMMSKYINIGSWDKIYIGLSIVENISTLFTYKSL